MNPSTALDEMATPYDSLWPSNDLWPFNDASPFEAGKCAFSVDDFATPRCGSSTNRRNEISPGRRRRNKVPPGFRIGGYLRPQIGADGLAGSSLLVLRGDSQFFAELAYLHVFHAVTSWSVYLARNRHVTLSQSVGAVNDSDSGASNGL